jgi:hypothetical protein
VLAPLGNTDYKSAEPGTDPKFIEMREHSLCRSCAPGR